MKHTLPLAFVALLFVASCKQDDEEPPAPTPVPTTGTIQMSFAFTSGNDPFSMSATYQDGAGNNIRFDAIKFYVSDIHLSDADENEVAHFQETVLLVDASAASNVFALGAINPVSVHEARIALGLDSALNHADPAQADPPLNEPGMHWSWNTAAGYKFLLMEGLIDGNDDGDFDDTEDVPFIYHCATDDLLRETEVHIHANVAAGSTSTLAAKVDVSVLIGGLNMLANPVAMGGGANNIIAMDSLGVAIHE